MALRVVGLVEENLWSIMYAMGATLLVKATVRMRKNGTKAGNVRGGTRYVNTSRPTQENRAISKSVESDERLDILPQQVKASITI
jgi:hypothetical protein